MFGILIFNFIVSKMAIWKDRDNPCQSQSQMLLESRMSPPRLAGQLGRQAGK